MSGFIDMYDLVKPFELKESKTRYYDLKNPILNFMFSGDCRKGLPSGVGHILAGPKASGKTSIVVQAIESFVLDNPDTNKVFLIETEGSNIKDYLISKIGVANYSKCIRELKIRTVEDLHYFFVQCLDRIEKKEYYKTENYLFVVDSFGQLNTRAEIDGALNSDMKADVGRTQKKLKALFRAIAIPLSITGSTLIGTNHQYSSLDGTGKQIDAGGTGVAYYGSNIFSLNKSKLWEDRYEVDGDKIKKLNAEETGINLYVKVSKSRYIAESISHFTLDFNFKNQLNEKVGVLPACLEHGLIETKAGGSQGTKYVLYNGKEFYKKEYDVGKVKFEDVFTEEVIDELNRRLQEKWKLGTENIELNNSDEDIQDANLEFAKVKIPEIEKRIIEIQNLIDNKELDKTWDIQKERAYYRELKKLNRELDEYRRTLEKANVELELNTESEEKNSDTSTEDILPVS